MSFELKENIINLPDKKINILSDISDYYFAIELANSNLSLPNINETKTSDINDNIDDYNFAIDLAKDNIDIRYKQAEKIAELIKQAAGKLPDDDIYKQAHAAYDSIMNDPKWKNQKDFGKVLATEQHNRNEFNKIVQQLATMGIDRFNPDNFYMCEVFDGAAQLLPNPVAGINVKRDANGNCDGELVQATASA